MKYGDYQRAVLPLTGTEYFVVTQNGETRHVLVSDVRTPQTPLVISVDGEAVAENVTLINFINGAVVENVGGVAVIDINSGATVNQPDEFLLDRANHTGTQEIATIDGLESQLAAKSKIAAVVAVASSKTVGLSDAWNYLQVNSASAVDITVPPQADVAWEANTEIHIEQAGAGAVSIVAGAGVTINRLSTSAASIAGQYGVVTLKRVASNAWTLFGALGAA